MIYILTWLQLYKKCEVVSLSNNDMYASDAEKLLKEAARPRLMTIDARFTEGDTVEEGFDEVGDENVETESEDDNLEATRQYWEVKQKQEGIHKVYYHVLWCMMCDVYLIADVCRPSPRKTVETHRIYDSAS